MKTLFKRLKERIEEEITVEKPVLFGLGISGRPDVIKKRKYIRLLSLLRLVKISVVLLLLLSKK